MPALATEHVVRLYTGPYNRQRPHRTLERFVVSPGHHSEPDHVLAELERFTTIEKTGEEGSLVSEQGPRA